MKTVRDQRMPGTIYWPGVALSRVVAIVALGFVSRLAIVAYSAPRRHWTNDELNYFAWGLQLTRTGSYLQNPVADKMPGMAALVAAGSYIGPSAAQYLPLVLFAFAGAMSALFLWSQIARSLRPAWRLGALTTLEFAVLDILVTVYVLLPDLICLFLSLIALAALNVSLERQHFWRTACAGAVLGLMLYFRPDYFVSLLLVPLFWALLNWNTLSMKGVILSLVLIWGVAFLVIAPWGARNFRLTGRFLIFSNRGSMQLWWAFHDSRHLDFVPGGEPWDSVAPKDVDQVKAQAGRDAIHWVRQHPTESVFLLVSRVISHVSPRPPGTVFRAGHVFPARWMRFAYRGISALIHELWVVAGILALVLGWRHLPKQLALLCFLVISRLIFPAAILPDGGRYALVLVPCLASCAIWFAAREGFQCDQLRVAKAKIVTTLTSIFAVQLGFAAVWWFQ